MKIALLFGLLGAIAYQVCKFTGVLNPYIGRGSFVWTNQGMAAVIGGFCVVGLLLGSMFGKKKKA
jgi:hypothetical protein